MLPLRPSVFHDDVLPFDVARFVQALPEADHIERVGLQRPTGKIADHRDGGRLRLRRNGQRGCSASNHFDEIASSHLALNRGSGARKCSLEDTTPIMVRVSAARPLRVNRYRVVPGTGPAMSAMPLSGSNYGALATPRQAIAG